MSNQTVNLNDSAQLADLIERSVIHQENAITSAVKEDREDLGDCESLYMDVSFGDSISLTVRIGGGHFDPIRVDTNKIQGFWSDGVVSSRISLERFGRNDPDGAKPSLQINVSTSAGGEELGELTEAQAYINKGKAIQIVAEAMHILESGRAMGENLSRLVAAHDRLADLMNKRRDEARKAKIEAFREKLNQDSDLILVSNIEPLVEAAKALALDSEYGQKIVLAFHDGQTTEKEGVDALKAVAFYNNSTSNRRLSAQYMGYFLLIDGLKHEPSGSGRYIDKFNLKDLKSYLSMGSGVFVSRSKTDRRLFDSLK